MIDGPRSIPDPKRPLLERWARTVGLVVAWIAGAALIEVIARALAP